jgi:hypothetical protein
MTGNPHWYYMGIGKNGSSKRSRNLAGFPGFSKKTSMNTDLSKETEPSQAS